MKIFKVVYFFLFTDICSNINGTVGPVRKSSDIGLPQDSALSPILFRIYIMNVAADLNNREDISILKFADDGTIKLRSGQLGNV